jgi:hypothetical protein
MSKAAYNLSLLSLCLLAFAIRLQLLEDVFLHDDEVKSRQLYVEQAPGQILRHYTVNNHWLSSGLGHLMGYLGFQRFLLRWPSVFWGTLAVPLLAVTGCRLFKRRGEGVIAALLLAFSAFHVQWSQQFRGYTALLFFGLLSFLLLYQALQKGNKVAWLSFLAAALLTIASHLFGVLMIVSLLAILAGWTGYNFASRKIEEAQIKVRAIVFLVTLIVVVYFTWFAKIHILDYYHTLPEISLSQFIYYQIMALVPTLEQVYGFLREIVIAFTAYREPKVASLLFMGPVILGVSLSLSQSPRSTLLLLVWLALPLALVIVAEFAVPGFFVSDRYLIFILPAWLLWVSRSVYGILDTFDRLSTSFGFRSLACLWRRPYGGILDSHRSIQSPHPNGKSHYGVYPYSRSPAPVLPYSPASLASAFSPSALLSTTFLVLSLGYLGWLNLQIIQSYFADRAGHDWRTMAAYLAGRFKPGDLIICKQLPHVWPSLPLEVEERCAKEMEYRLQEQGKTLYFPATSLEKVSALDTWFHFKDKSQTPGVVWLIVWGEVRPEVSITSVSASLKWQPEAEAIPPLFFDRLGQTTLLEVKHQPHLAGNLGEAIGYLAELDSASSDRFDYYLGQAQVLAYQARREEAQIALILASALVSERREAQAYLAQTSQMISFNFLQSHSAPTQPLQVDFGRPPLLRLTGYSLSPSLKAGEAGVLTTSWQALQPITTDYTVFLHLRDLTGQTVAQLDFRPFEGAYPTSQWQPGLTITESRPWRLPAHLAPGAYTLHLGLYHLETLTPLVPIQEEAEPGALLGEIKVQ